MPMATCSINEEFSRQNEKVDDSLIHYGQGTPKAKLNFLNFGLLTNLVADAILC